MVTTGAPRSTVAGLATLPTTLGPAVLPVRAAYAALADAAVPVGAVGAVIHAGPRPAAAQVGELLGAHGCRAVFDVGPDATSLIAALAVGSSLVDSTGVVLVTVEQHDGTSSLVLVDGPGGVPDSPPVVLHAASPVAGLLECRRSGRYDVVVVADDGRGPTASVRCRLLPERGPVGRDGLT